MCLDELVRLCLEDIRVCTSFRFVLGADDLHHPVCPSHKARVLAQTQFSSEGQFIILIPKPKQHTESTGSTRGAKFMSHE